MFNEVQREILFEYSLWFSVVCLAMQRYICICSKLTSTQIRYAGSESMHLENVSPPVSNTKANIHYEG
jgi:hypothetical protein